jgi:Ecdysteroid kinase-like family
MTEPAQAQVQTQAESQAVASKARGLRPATETDRPYPQRTDRLARNLSDVTPEWMTAMLANRYSGVVVNNFETIELLSTHTTKLRLKLDLNDAGVAAGIPTDVCLKSNWSNGIKTGDICEMEARFYHVIKDAVNAPIPNVFYADWDGDGGGRGLVMMEDLAGGGNRFGNSADHLGIDGVTAGVESLAALHASLWGKEAEKQTRLPRSMTTSTDTEQVVRIYNYMALNLEDPVYQAVLPSWAYETPEMLNHLLDELSAYELEQTGPLSLLHGDSHQGNSYVDASGRRKWVDFQLARKGTPWRDLCYFMIAALTVEERRAVDRDLVKHYRETLMSLGAQDVPSQDVAWEQFRRWPAYGMQCWLGNVDQWGQTGVDMIRRFYAAGDEYDTVALLTAGKKPRRIVRLGEEASALPPDLQAILDSRRR